MPRKAKNEPQTGATESASMSAVANGEPKPEPQELPEMKGPGVERKTIPEIEKQADVVSDLCAERMKKSENEREARAKLLALMDTHGVLSYRLHDGRVVYVDDKRKAKIKSADEDEE
jgi:hypothetical protein